MYYKIIVNIVYILGKEIYSFKKKISNIHQIYRPNGLVIWRSNNFYQAFRKDFIHLINEKLVYILSAE